MALTLVLWLGGPAELQPPTSDLQPPTSNLHFTNIAREAGLDMTTVFGGRESNTYLVETTGTGVAMLDYDGDGWVDLFFVNGSTLEGFPSGAEPTSHLYRNKGNRTFEDVTVKAGLAAGGWGQGACVGDYDNDGHDDLFVTYWGQNRLYHNDGHGHFTDVAETAGLRAPHRKWSTGCAFLDYDRDGRLDLFAGSYIDFDPATTPRPESGLCRYRGLRSPVDRRACPAARTRSIATAATARSRTCRIPPGSRAQPAPTRWASAPSTSTTTAGSTSTSRMTRVRARSIATITTARSPTSRSAPAAPTARTARPRPGWVSPSATTIATGRWTSSGPTSPATPRRCMRNTGRGLCEDRTFAGGFGLNTRWLGWGTAFVDFDNDGWLDLLLMNGHVYPEVRQVKSEAGYEQPKVLYRNLR